MGLEPTTYAATKHRSTIELQAPKGERRVELRTSSLQNYCSTIELFTRSVITVRNTINQQQPAQLTTNTSRIGLEPTTSRLTVARSTIELPRQNTK